MVKRTLSLTIDLAFFFIYKKPKSMRQLLTILLIITLFGCKKTENTSSIREKKINPKTSQSAGKSNQFFQNTKHVTHVIVALCDNKNQGIVKVPAAIGNGQDARNNLYWGCAYGVKTYFRNQAEWTIIHNQEKINDIILERVIFKHQNGKNILVADAYDGKFIKKATDEYLKSLSGQILRTITIDKDTLGIYGNAELLTFIGHNGLMEFNLPIENYTKKDNKTRDAIILACISKDYFQPYFDKFGTNSLLMSTGLMSPEAYTLDAALDSYISGNEKPHVRLQAAKAYHQYQKCGVSAALGLLVND